MDDADLRARFEAILKEAVGQSAPEEDDDFQEYWSTVLDELIAAARGEPAPRPRPHLTVVR